MKPKRPGPKSEKEQLPPISLPMGTCDQCRYPHPKPKQASSYADGKGPFLNCQHVAGFLGVKVSTIYSQKSRRQLPPCLPGKKNPAWDPCVIAIFVYEGRLVGPTLPVEKA
jgi:predicted DNA-binding transcriptional regulator AlpA